MRGIVLVLVIGVCAWSGGRMLGWFGGSEEHQAEAIQLSAAVPADEATPGEQPEASPATVDEVVVGEAGRVSAPQASSNEAPSSPVGIPSTPPSSWLRSGPWSTAAEGTKRGSVR